MLNFTEELDQQETTVQSHRDEVPAVQERATVTPLSAPVPEPTSVQGERRLPTNRRPDLTPHSEWEKLRDYVIDQLEQRAPFPRDVRHENTIFMGFQDRWGELAMPIAQFVFEKADGRWLGAPMSIARFEKSSDRVFGTKIAEQL